MPGLDSTFDAALAPIRAAVDDRILAGAVTLVWQGGQLRHLGATGYRDIDAGLSMAENTIFRIASMTKPIISAATMSLVDDGTIRLSDPITTWLPEFSDMRVLKDPEGPLDDTFRAPRLITVEDLLTHRSGLTYDFISTGPIAKAYHPLHTAAFREPDEWLAAIAALPLVYPPGERFHYSHSTDVLGLLIARAAGLALNTLLRQRILDPLGMNDTDFFVPEHKAGRLARLYGLGDDDTIVAADSGYLTAMPTSAPALCRGGGALASTAHDYLTFARALLGGGQADGVRILSPESTQALRTNRLTPAQRRLPSFGIPYWTGRGFGLGLSVVMDPNEAALFGPSGTGTFGWPGAFGTWWHADPKADAILMFLPQWRMPELDPKAALARTSTIRLQLLHVQFGQAVYAAL
ncbi:Probable beta-lactamase [Mycobacteroides abscessus subsp. bolletii]|uniref:serine hydrolase domain-containing protein n=1 Tax=Mycobacteroides abscessus TaxID=36809 RepID=UPI0009A8165B|nr:serine hydrolase domain-containing protein [Mycobacteroides abscessus]SKG03555.1 Probable beta-lactamase [Mycobacteroides abscessus subsp. bolletii]SKG39519.1 Probable beta-lactamase [Mycobacteroides abscessus subsp. bolletii]